MPTSGSPDAATWGGRENQVYARFYRDHVVDVFASQQEGMTVAKQVDMIEIRQIGERDTCKEVVNELHKRRFPQAWSAFQQGVEQVQNGTPLAALFPANPEVVETLKGFHIYTVQALVAVADSSGAKIPFLTEWKKRATTFLEGIEKGKGFHALQSELETERLKRMEQDDLITTLSARLNELEKDKPTKSLKE